MTRKSSGFRGRLRLLTLALATSALAACATGTVMVAKPPRVELSSYPAIGVIDFVAQPPGELSDGATQKMIGDLQSAQPGLRIIELGNQERLLKEVGMHRSDPDAVKAIGVKYGVEAIVSGTITLEEVRSNIKTSTGLSAIPSNSSSFSAKTKVDGRMSAMIWETSSGATTWRNSSKGSWTVAGLSFKNGDTAGFRYPQEKQDQIVTTLLKTLNADFRPSYENRAMAK